MWRRPWDKDGTMRGRAMHPQVRREREKRERRATASAFGRRVASHLLRQSMTLRIVQSWNRPPFALYLYLRKFSKTHWRRRTDNMWPTHIFIHSIGKLCFSRVAATPPLYSPQHAGLNNIHSNFVTDVKEQTARQPYLKNEVFPESRVSMRLREKVANFFMRVKRGCTIYYGRKFTIDQCKC